jgi:microsomal dipeptidase-like Zn-dependent dipeptidase
MNTKKIPVFDGHNDTLMLMVEKSRSFTEKSDIGHFDIPRALEGGFAGGLFAIFVSSEQRDKKSLSSDDSLPEEGDPDLWQLHQTMPKLSRIKGLMPYTNLKKSPVEN